MLAVDGGRIEMLSAESPGAMTDCATAARVGFMRAGIAGIAAAGAAPGAPGRATGRRVGRSAGLLVAAGTAGAVACVAANAAVNFSADTPALFGELIVDQSAVSASVDASFF